MNVTASAGQVAHLPDGRIIIAKPGGLSDDLATRTRQRMQLHGIPKGTDATGLSAVTDAPLSPPADLAALTEACKTCGGSTGTPVEIYTNEWALMGPGSCRHCHAGRPLFDLKVECAVESDEALVELKHGEEVAITWSGGNGPHRYRINQDQGGTYAVWVHEAFDESNWTWRYNPISFVGTEQFHTRVTRFVTHAGLYVPDPILPVFGPHMQRSEVRDFISLRKGGPWLNRRDVPPTRITAPPAIQPGDFAVIAQETT